MAETRSVHAHLQNYDRHLNRLEELRALLYELRAGTPAARAAEAALERMDHGDYGLCRLCGALIPLAHLLRTPDRPTCVSCATPPRPREAA
ncbi:TraR/DksA C4-type zinc finger protein [Nonomuraea sp. NPDC050328]|uniref:TraR/DksA C4-type zinc finger protein n=1 Tax=Nonomuraea sp. NPDC050328 TaxID=3364361 RepID=UPI00378B85B8